jgi:hypothetical protein
LLDYDCVYLSEGGWPMAAYQDAATREHRRGKPRPLNYASSKAPRVAYGPYEQRLDKVQHLPVESPTPIETPIETTIPEPAVDKTAILVPIWKPSVTPVPITPVAFESSEPQPLPTVGE